MLQSAKTKNEQIADFLRKFKVVINSADEVDEDARDWADYTFKIATLFEGKPILNSRFSCGRAVYNKHGITGFEVVDSLFRDAEAYEACEMATEGRSLTAFIKEFGFKDNIERGLKAFESCKHTWEVLKSILKDNCHWNEDSDDEFVVVDISDIDWDTDDSDEEDSVSMGTEEPLWNLPTEVEGVEIPCAKGDDLEEVVADWLSDKYGFAVNGCSFEVKSKVNGPDDEAGNSGSNRGDSDERRVLLDILDFADEEPCENLIAIDWDSCVDDYIVN